MDVLVFRLQGQRFGLPAASVQEVRAVVATTHLPKAPGIVEGIVDVHGDLAAVLDVRARFHLPPQALSASDHLVIARAAGRTVALRVDATEGVADMDPGTLEAVPGVPGVAGVARLPDGLVLLHDIDAFLSEAEAAELESALGAAAGTACES